MTTDTRKIRQIKSDVYGLLGFEAFAFSKMALKRVKELYPNYDLRKKASWKAIETWTKARIAASQQTEPVGPQLDWGETEGSVVKVYEVMSGLVEAARVLVVPVRWTDRPWEYRAGVVVGRLDPTGKFVLSNQTDIRGRQIHLNLDDAKLEAEALAKDAGVLLDNQVICHHVG